VPIKVANLQNEEAFVTPPPSTRDLQLTLPTPIRRILFRKRWLGVAMRAITAACSTRALTMSAASAFMAIRAHWRASTSCRPAPSLFSGPVKLDDRARPGSPSNPDFIGQPG
jgi:hypothetical protein